LIIVTKRIVAAACAASVIMIGAAAAQTTAPKAKIEPTAQTTAKTQKPATQPGVRPAGVENGLASVYCFRNGPTASGERSRPALLAAAHKTLPFGTLVEVTNQKNGRSIVVRINDRGPYVGGRIIDLTPAGARALKFDGLTNVTVRVLNNHRDSQLAARAL
jgi:peptidoglycan lytic transglycosylase